MNKESFRERLIEVLEQNNLKLHGAKKFFLINFNGDVVNPKDTETNETLVLDKNFKLSIVSGQVVLETTNSNQNITDEWIVNLFKMKKIKDIIEWEISKVE